MNGEWLRSEGSGGEYSEVLRTASDRDDQRVVSTPEHTLLTQLH